MTAVRITATSKDVPQYNRDMSALNEAFRPIAEKFGASPAISPGDEPGKPAMTVFFNDAANARSFADEAQAAASKRTWYGARKLPGMKLTVGE
jgi:hypothetical protein